MKTPLIKSSNKKSIPFSELNPEVAKQLISEVSNFLKKSSDSFNTVTLNGQKIIGNLRTVQNNSLEKALDEVQKKLDNPDITIEESKFWNDRQDQLLDRQDNVVNKQSEENDKDRNEIANAIRWFGYSGLFALGLIGIKEAKKFFPKNFT